MKSFTALLIAVLSTLALCGTAAAHSGLAAASPGPGAVVGGTVERIELWYGGSVTEISASITDPSGLVLDAELVQVSDLRMVLELAEPLSEPGEYAVRHGTTGVEDGDRIDAAYLFTFDPAAPPPALDFLPVDDGGISTWVWVVVGIGVVLIGVLTWRLVTSLRRLRPTHA